MREEVVVELVELLHEHHREELKLMDMIRQGRLKRHARGESVAWANHDNLERDTLHAMASATEDEIQAALFRYEAGGGYL